MLAQMMRRPLLISSLLEHADTYHGDAPIVTRTVEGGLHRYTYSDFHRRSRQTALALERLGVKPGERIATLAWNTYRHLELYFAISCAGSVCHTINPRLFHEQIVYIINHAEDSVLFFDSTFASLVAQIRDRCPTVEHWVALVPESQIPDATPFAESYDALVSAEPDSYAWPELDENTASLLCYTSGTTGNPKGVLFSHRSTILHSFGTALPDVMDLSSRDSVCPVVPMFHASCWGLPYTCPMVGAKLVLPGMHMDGASLYELFEREGVTFAGGVPTVWQGVLAHMQANGLKFSTLKRFLVGGAACPPAIIRAMWEDYGVEALHGWGMTELSPVGTLNTFKAKHARMSDEDRIAFKCNQGRALYGVEMRLIGPGGEQLAHDGESAGELHVRGPWVVERYYKSDRSPLVDGWFPTGDVATIDRDGYLKITDRSKDVIKSGGEWISSIALENIATLHPAVAIAASISIRHPKWDERPLLVVVKKSNQDVTKEELLGFFEGKVAKWWVPDDVVFVESIPLTATGKMSKLTLREQFKDYRFPET
jgi:fatty-acyl-CoA synthase